MLLDIAPTERTPEIKLIKQPLTLSVKGESFPEDVSAFYGQVIHTINDLPNTVSGPLSVELAMVYINSSSIKAFYRMFEGIEAYRKTGHDVTVIWKAEEDDDIMQELGEDFKDRFEELNFSIEQHG
ncbi:MAG: DUF1987 domain-containing protein [Limnohabitans sp.]